ncbi:condensation domain-containing protein [Siphonobacter aquaeclarae]|uniref:Phthiocerol/phthiodiolone dimycocerosyl transferase n=1 Tax=Siphonobacter aquaeclarae TaxID=563176 RepID=A0A1G9ISB3_9BACT|nr:condensation domain-containing protein [Siphonobacter aquaeclarae]SDL28070.1 Condensation domain-containing protein [Siphonobacter aquaeclarae]
MERKLLFGERMLHGDGNTPFNAIIPFRLRGNFTESAVHNALAGVQKKHPWLKARVGIDERDCPWFLVDGTPRPIPVEILPRRSEDDWLTESRRQWTVPFDTANGPLLRLSWIRDEQFSDMILTIHHCLCDGGSAMTILAEFLTLLENPAAEIGLEDPVKGIADIVPAAVLNHPAKKIKAKLTGGLIRTALRVIPVKKRPFDRGEDYLLHWKWERACSSALIQACKEAGVTVNTALCTALLLAFREVRGEKAFNKVSCPVDIRRLAPEIRPDHIFAFGMMFVVSAGKNRSFIENARAIQADVDRKSLKLNPYATVMAMEEAHAAMADFTDLLRYGKSSNDCMFSNLGRIPIRSEYGSFVLETIFSPSVIGPLGNTTTMVTSTYGGQMDFSFIGSEGYLPKRDAVAIRETLTRLLTEELLQTEPVPA